MPRHPHHSIISISLIAKTSSSSFSTPCCHLKAGNETAKYSSKNRIPRQHRLREWFAGDFYPTDYTAATPEYNRTHITNGTSNELSDSAVKSYGPITNKYIYLILYGISSIPDPEEWALVTGKYMTDFFNGADHRVDNAEVNIELVGQLDTGGQTEVLYIQNTFYMTDRKKLNWDEIVSGPFYTRKNRNNYVNVLKEINMIGYAKLTDTSIAESLGDLDLTPRNNWTSLKEDEDKTAMYVWLGLGGFVFVSCGCFVLLCISGMVGYYIMSSSKPVDDEFDEDELEVWADESVGDQGDDYFDRYIGEVSDVKNSNDENHQKENQMVIFREKKCREM